MQDLLAGTQAMEVQTNDPLKRVVVMLIRLTMRSDRRIGAMGMAR